MFSLFKDRIFLRNLGWLAIPIIINEMLNSLINMMDTFMTGQIGGSKCNSNWIRKSGVLFFFH